MGKTSRFRSESSQFIVVATVMLGLLATSLGVAHRLSRRPPMQDITVGGLKLTLPESWQPLGNHPRSPALDAEKVLIDTADPARRLLLGRLIPNAPHTAWESLDIVRRTTLDFQDLSTFHVHESKRYHSGHRSTHTFMASSQSETGVVVHQFAFITEDARTYWLIHLRVAVDETTSDASNARSDVRLMSMLTSQAQNTTWRNAKASDYRAAGIEVRDNITMPPGIHARVRVDASPGDPVLIVPGSNRLGVVAAHIRGVVDVTDISNDGINAGSRDLTPEHLLSERFHREMGRELRDEESWSGEITPEGGRVALSAWSVRFEGEPVHPQLQPLMRQLFYVRTSQPGRAMLIELVHESPGVKDIRSWVGTIVAALSRQMDVDAESEGHAAASVAAHIAAGRHIAAESRASLATALGEGATYFQIARRGRPFGFQAEQIARSTADGGWVRGRTLAILGDTSGFPIRYTWEVDPAGRGMRITTAGGSAQSSFEIQVALEDKTLKLIRPEQDAWSVEVPDGYLLPIVEDHWPIQSMSKMEHAEALVWRSFHRYPPEPWLLKWRRLPQGDPSGAAWELCFRPLMAVNEDRILLDEDGAVLEFQGWERNTRHTGAVRIDVIRVSRDKLTRSHPDWMESLRNWEQDWNQP